MVEALIALGVVGGVLVVVNVIYHLVAGRRGVGSGCGVAAGDEEGLESGADAERSSPQSPDASESDEHLLLLKPLEEQEAIRAKRREDELRKHPLQGLIEDVESERE